MSLRRWIAIAITLTYTALHAFTAYSWLKDPGVPRPLGLCPAFFALGYGVAATGLLRRAYWARLYGIGIAIAGLLNLVTFGLVARDPPISSGLAQGFAFTVLLATLSGSRMRAQYDGRGPLAESGRHLALRAAKLTTILAVTTVPMLFWLAATARPWLGQTARLGLVLTGATYGIGAIGVVRGRTAGLFTIMVAGAAAVILVVPIGARVFFSGCKGSRDMLCTWQYPHAIEAMLSLLPGLVVAVITIAAFGRSALRWCSSSNG
jgi:hypothetical protein